MVFRLSDWKVSDFYDGKLVGRATRTQLICNPRLMKNIFTPVTIEFWKKNESNFEQKKECLYCELSSGEKKSVCGKRKEMAGRVFHLFKFPAYFISSPLPQFFFFCFFNFRSKVLLNSFERFFPSKFLKWLHNFFLMATLITSFRRVQRNNCIAGLQENSIVALLSSLK